VARSTNWMPVTLAILCVRVFDVDLEFLGGVSEPGVVDVVMDVPVDGAQRVA
jgi:hypothetical protein